MNIYEEYIQNIEEDISIKSAKSHLNSLWSCFYFIYDKNIIAKCVIRMVIYYHRKVKENKVNQYLNIIDEWNIFDTPDDGKLESESIFIIILFKVIYARNQSKKYTYFGLLIDYINNHSIDAKAIKSHLKYCIKIFTKNDIPLFSHECYRILIIQLKERKPNTILDAAKCAELLGSYTYAAKFYDMHGYITNSDNSKMSCILCSFLCRDKKRIKKYKNLFYSGGQEQSILEDIAYCIETGDTYKMMCIFDGYGTTPALLDIKKKIDSEKNISFS